MLVYILLAVAIILLYKFGTKNFDYFQKKGIPFNKPHLFVGSRLSTLMRTQNIIEFMNEIYCEHKDEK
jgi:hypothetical protein